LSAPWNLEGNKQGNNAPAQTFQDEGISQVVLG
jgi:hypothetical protein